VQPTRVLTAEHRRIEQALVVVSAFIAQLRRREPLAGADVDALLTFLRRYGEGYHHELEERILAEALSQIGLPKDSGPVAAMLAQHREAEKLIEIARSASARRGEASSQAAGDDADRDLADALQAYERLLVQHIRYEEHVLYPFAERLLPLLRMDLLIDAFGRRDAEQAAAIEAQLEALAALRRRYVE